MTEPTVNIPLLRKAVEWAETEAAKPKHLSQWNQVDTAILAEDLGRETDCGTCFCVAGYIVSLGHKVSVNEWGEAMVDGDPTVSICAMARDLLGIDESMSLFAYNNTIEDVRRIAESIAGESL